MRNPTSFSSQRARRAARPAAWRAVAFLVAGLLVAAPLAVAHAQVKTKSKQARGKVVRYDGDAKRLVVKERGKEIVYNVKPEGSVLTRTVVTINGQRADLQDLPADGDVIVYWRPNPADENQRDARKIDAPRIPPELLED